VIVLVIVIMNVNMNVNVIMIESCAFHIQVKLLSPNSPLVSLSLPPSLPPSLSLSWTTRIAFHPSMQAAVRVRVRDRTSIEYHGTMGACSHQDPRSRSSRLIPSPCSQAWSLSSSCSQLVPIPSWDFLGGLFSVSLLLFRHAPSTSASPPLSTLKRSEVRRPGLLNVDSWKWVGSSPFFLLHRISLTCALDLCLCD
jgi:hypothetical protein